MMAGFRRWTDAALPLPDEARLVGWALTQFAVYLVEQVAELVAPLLFVAGLGWYVVIRVLAAVGTDDPKLQDMIDRFPRSLALDGRVVDPHRLIVDGLWLMVVVAACRTLTAVLARTGPAV